MEKQEKVEQYLESNIKNMNLTSMLSDRGNPVKNQYILIDREDNSILFKSYNSNIALIPEKGKMIIGRDYDYSATTMKYTWKFAEQYLRTFEFIKEQVGKFKTHKEFFDKAIKLGLIDFDETL